MYPFILCGCVQFCKADEGNRTDRDGRFLPASVCEICPSSVWQTGSRIMK